MVRNWTSDDPFQFDGKGDEVWVQVDWIETGPGGQLVDEGSSRSRTMGDINGDFDRIQGGSLSDKGGFKFGDVYPTGFDIDHPERRIGSLSRTRIPMEIGVFDLRIGRGGVGFIPTIWEWDGGAIFLQTWLESIANNGGNIAKFLWEAFVGRPGGDAIGDAIHDVDNLILDAVGRGGDRPIGLTALGDNKYQFTGKTLLLNYERAKKVVSRDFGLQPFNFKDVGPNLNGDYTLWLRVEELEPLFD